MVNRKCVARVILKLSQFEEEEIELHPFFTDAHVFALDKRSRKKNSKKNHNWFTSAEPLITTSC